jgi:hypothetical protein
MAGHITQIWTPRAEALAGLLDLWPRGRADALPASDLRPHGWRPLQTLQIPDWCGCSTEYLPVPVGDGRWQLVLVRRDHPASDAGPGSGQHRWWEPPW